MLSRNRQTFPIFSLVNDMVIFQGINRFCNNLIKDFTGYKDIIYNHCQEIVDEENGIVSHAEKCRKLDVSLRMGILNGAF